MKQKKKNAGRTAGEAEGAALETDSGPGPKKAGPRGLVKAALKVLLIWIPLSVLGITLVVMAALPLVLTPKRVESIAASAFRSASNGELSLSVKRFNPYTGFDIQNIVIYNGDEFGRTKFLEIERLKLDYKFFGMLIGKVRFNEIGIYRPRVYLVEKNGVWNVSRLMKPGEAEPEKKPEEKGGTTDEIKLPFSVDFLLKFVLEDLRTYVRGEGLNVRMEGLGLTADVKVPPFKRLPLSLEAVSLLERMSISLNPKGELDVSVYTPDAEVDPPLLLSWKLDFKKASKEKGSFASSLRLGTNRTPVRFKRTRLAPLNLLVSYDMLYDPGSDVLRLDSFGVSFGKSKWVELNGSVRDVTGRQEMDIRMTQSSISLDELYPYYVAITGDRDTRFGGLISLLPLTVKGTPSSMNIGGELGLAGVSFRVPGAEAALPSLKLAFAMRKHADDIRLELRLGAPRFTYALERSRSADNGMEMALDASANGGFDRLKVDSFKFRLYNPNGGQNALDIGARADVAMGQDLSGRLDMDRFRFQKEPLEAMLPPSVRRSIAKLPLSKPVDISLNTTFGIKGKKTRASALMNFRVPDFDLTDLKLDVGLEQDDAKKRISLERLRLTSDVRGLLIDARGTVDLKKKPISDSDLKLTVRLNSSELAAIYGPWKIKGLVDINAAVKGDVETGKASGSIKIARFHLQNEGERLYVDDLNVDFPFEYYFKPRYMGESRIAVDKSLLLTNENFREKANFTVASVRARHPARDISFEYLKDFSALMFFKENTFEIPVMRAYVLDGSLYGRDILFNLANMNPEDMEFRMILDVTNVDIGVLDDPDARKKTRDAELSLNANFSGKGLNIKRELTAQGYINIYKIGEKFANRLLKGLSTEKGTSKLGGVAQFAVDNSMTVKSFNFNLERGLVYATVGFSRRTIGYLFGVKDEKVEFDRMPIQEYLRKVREVEQ